MFQRKKTISFTMGSTIDIFGARLGMIGCVPGVGALSIRLCGGRKDFLIHQMLLWVGSLLCIGIMIILLDVLSKVFLGFLRL